VLGILICGASDGVEPEAAVELEDAGGLVLGPAQDIATREHAITRSSKRQTKFLFIHNTPQR
jgi:hypothetical protein